jgi:transcriptional regulator with XRE-family HTH domain
MRKGVLPICHLVLRAKKPKEEGYPAKPETLGEHIRKRRMDLALIQRAVAFKIGVDASTIWKWENGWSIPELRHLPAILAFLGYDPRGEGAWFTFGRLVVGRRRD